MAERQFSERDLRRWAERGLITRDQLSAILAAEAGLGPEGAEGREGLNLPTISYYLGASLALIAIGVFAGVNWADAGEGARLAIIAGSMGLVGGAGYYVWTGTPYRRGGSALLTIAVAMIPLLLFAVTALFAERESETLFDEESLDEASVLQAASLCAMVVVLLWSRVGMLAVAVSGQAVALTATGAVWALEDGDITSEVHLALTVVAAMILIAGLALSMRPGRGEEAFWFELSGSVVFLYAFTFFAMAEWHLIAPGLYISVAAGLLAAGTALRRLSLLLVGAGLVYSFILRLVFDTFEGSPLLPLAIAAAGLSMIALAMAYQRQRRAVA